MAAETFTVTYADNVAVNVATLDSTNVLITGPNNYSQLATFLIVDNSTNGTPRTATYQVAAPSGTWATADNGNYDLTVQAGQVADTSGNYMPTTAVGALFTVYIPPADTTPPSVSGYSAANVLKEGGATEMFTVTYADDVAVNVSTLDSNDVLVTGPNNYSQLATYLGVDFSNNGTPRTATYQIAAPGGTWNPANNGTYNLAVQSGQVADTSGNYMPVTAIGSFNVNVPPASPVLVSPGSNTSPMPTVTNTTQTFKWKQVAGASSYLLELQDVTAGTGVKRYTITGGSTTSYAIGLTAGHNYKWEVFAYAGSSHGLPSTQYRFAVITPPAAPILLSPGTSASPVPTVTGTVQTFKWQKVPSATSYLLELQDVTAATAVKRYTISSGSTTSFKINLIAGHTYKWELYAYDGSLHGLPSKEFQFKIHS